MTENETRHGNDWPHWSTYVRKGIEENKETYKELRTELNKVVIEIAVLKVKVAFWGAMGAGLGTVVLNLIFYLLKVKS
jgi:hypothetical protein